MRLKACSTLLLCLLTTVVFSQYKLTGHVTTNDTLVVQDFVVLLNDGTRTAVTDRKGNFVFEDLANGEYVVHFANEEYAYQVVNVTIRDKDQRIKVVLASRSSVLDEVVITDAGPAFGFTKMRGVENMGIYEGKKSEVIIPEQLVANLATNNARQVYARVAGLNIWENDGAGIQLSIGGRGLDPNRTANFNVRQNGYDISADALGYPESYYTPPVEGIGRIEIIRGAASLQYGTQFGGLINFSMKKPVADKKFELLARQTVGSFGFYNTFTSISGTVKKLSYYSFFQYKRGDGWRPNSEFDNHTWYANVNYQLSEKSRIGIDITQMGYLAQQPGGLSDVAFNTDPRQSLRKRNWFNVNWNLGALHFDHKFNMSTEFNLRMFGLLANRYAIGFRPNRVDTEDAGTERRDLIKGDFRNWGAEARFLKRYNLFTKPSVFLIGTRYYHGFNHSLQGDGSAKSSADFKFPNEDEDLFYNYEFPNENISFFIEHIVYLTPKLSITPGIRYENIHTVADGYYEKITRDLAGNIVTRDRVNENRTSPRQFVIAGVGVSFKASPAMEVYTNLSQNYRSITFNDMRIINPSAAIDPDLEDEKGFSFDLGIRSEQTYLFNYDVSYFILNYDNRIGDLSERIGGREIRTRTNIGQSIVHGLEAYGEVDWLGHTEGSWSGVTFANIGVLQSRYVKSEEPNVKGNKVEFVPDVNLKAGLRAGYKDLKASIQCTYMSEQFTDAQNTKESGASAVFGIIPAYTVLDFSVSYQYKNYRLEGNINNFTDNMYFTRRATGYPGPGIIPSDGRSFFLTLHAKF